MYVCLVHKSVCTLQVSENEQRDGAGGGFNERQDRASAATVEIDEEGFDDFGRRVKKLKRADRQAKEEAALKRLNEKYRHLIPTELETILTQKPDTLASSSVPISSSLNTDASDRRQDSASDSRQQQYSSGTGGRYSGRDRSRSRSRDRDRERGSGSNRNDSDSRYSNSGYGRNSGRDDRGGDHRREEYHGGNGRSDRYSNHSSSYSNNNRGKDYH